MSTEAENEAEALAPRSDPAPSTNWLTRLRERLGFEDADKRAIREVLDKALSEEGRGGKVLAPQQRDMLLRILRFGELRVADVMVPRADINALDEQAPLSELLQVFEQAGHSRIPLYRETLDDLRGMVHIKDLMGWLVAQSSTGPVVATAAAHAETPMHIAGIDLTRANLALPISATKIRRQVLFVPPSMPALNLFLRMQSTRVHLAMVVDEYGGTDGLVSIEDLVEQIVGEIEDEHDDEEHLIQEDANSGFITLARAPISELEERLGVKLVTDPEDAEAFDTVGGLVVAQLGRVAGSRRTHPPPFGGRVRGARSRSPAGSRNCGSTKPFRWRSTSRRPRDGKFFIRLSGWRCSAAAFVLGMASVLAMPPFDLWPVLFLTLPGWVLLLDGALLEPCTAWRRARAAAVVGWWFGFGYLLLGLYWIGAAFLVQADKFAVLMPFAITLLPAYLATYYAAGAAAASLVWRPGPGRLLALAIAVTAGECCVATGSPAFRGTRSATVSPSIRRSRRPPRWWASPASPSGRCCCFLPPCCSLPRRARARYSGCRRPARRWCCWRRSVGANGGLPQPGPRT